MTPVQRPALSFLHLHTMAGEAKMELTEPEKPYTKQLEQLGEGGVGYQRLQWGCSGNHQVFVPEQQRQYGQYRQQGNAVGAHQSQEELN